MRAVALACTAVWAGALLAPEALAQPASEEGGRSGRVVPTLEVAETLVYGNALGGSKQSESITRISPGLRWSSRSGRVQGSADYSLDASHYSRRRGEDAVDHRLNAALTAELLPRNAFVDVRANVARQPVSAYGQQFAAEDPAGNASRTTVSSLQISPYVQGRLDGFADLQLRLNAAVTDAKDVDSADSNSNGVSLSLNSVSSGQFSWGLNAQRQNVSFGQGSDTVNDRLSATLTWRPDIDWRLFVRGGRESTDIGALVKREYDNYGGGVAWTPSPRTTVAVESDKRFYGTGHRGLIEYRAPRTVFRYTDTRDTTNGGDLSFGSQPVTLFQLFFQQFASTFPDPIAREQAVNDYLRLIGRNGNELISFGGLADVVSVQRRQELAAIWNGRRMVFSLQFFGSDLRSLDRGLGVGAASPLPERTRQRGLNMSVSHRLDPVTSVSLSASRQTTSASGTLAGNRLDVLSAGVNRLFGPRLSGGVNLRVSEFDGGSASYREASATASLNLRF